MYDILQKAAEVRQIQGKDDGFCAELTKQEGDAPGTLRQKAEGKMIDFPALLR